MLHEKIEANALQVVLEKHLGRFHLNVAFQADAGITTVLLGESGAGKSTVLRLLAGLLEPERGLIKLHGTTYFEGKGNDEGGQVKRRRGSFVVPAQERPFGFVFQDYVLFPHLSVFENVAFGLRAQRYAQHDIVRRVGEALERVHLQGVEQRRPAQLSGGQQQRVAIARSLVLQPQLLLLDEPLAALDVQTRREVRQELYHLLMESKMTTVMVTHHYFEALLFGQQILVMDQGKIIQQGGQQELRSAPRSAYVAELVGTNFFRGRISRYEADQTCLITVSPSSPPIELAALLREARTTGVAIGEEAYVVISPRNITLHRQEPEGSARNVLHGRILHLLHTGESDEGGLNESGRFRISIALDGLPGTLPLTAEVTAASVQRMELQEGVEVYATFKASEASAYL